MSRIFTSQIEDNANDLQHYGTPRHSGRYPWGSGENPYQGDFDFMAGVNKLRKRGLTNTEIAREYGLKTGQLRAKIDIASENIVKGRNSEIFKLADKGYSKLAISRQLGIPDTTVGYVLKNRDQVKLSSTRKVADELVKEVAAKKWIDVGRGAETAMNISKEKLAHAVELLTQDGYKLVYLTQTQMGTGKPTTMKVLIKVDPKKTSKEMWKEANEAKKRAEIDFPGFHYEERDYENPHRLETPTSVDSKRIKVRYAEEGGLQKDGIIELRRGVEDLNLGKNKYAQVRIAVDGTHFIKGVAVYSDNMPDGVDIIVNSNKPKGTPLKSFDKNEEACLKLMKVDPITNNPFGASIKQDDEKELHLFQAHYTGKDGKQHLSAINMVNEQGTWEKWKRNLPAQLLSKQTIPLAKRQLNLDARMRKDDFEELKSITNPAVKKNLLESFADNCDSAAVHLKAAAMPRQAAQLLIPLPGIKENEIYAPNFRDGEKVVLIRFPHAGRFEIPELVVNNRYREGQRVIGKAEDGVRNDAVGIHPKVAEKLSGADFDGDTALVIPNDKGQIKTYPSLKELDGFADELRVRYKRDKNSDIPPMSSQEKGMQMGLVSNLITDMTLKGAPVSEIARAVKYSMVVIDAEKHDLDWRQAAYDNNIPQLYQRWQGKSRGGASTLISQSKGEYDLPHRKAGQRRIDPETGKSRVFYVDPQTGEKLYTTTGQTRWKQVLVDKIDPETGKVMRDPKSKAKIKEPALDEDGNPIYKQVGSITKSQKGYELDPFDPRMNSGTKMEKVYAEYATEMKQLANQARLEVLHIKPNKLNTAAKQYYLKEVQELNDALALAKANAPLERKAQSLASKFFNLKKQENPELIYDKDKIKKVRAQCLEEARYRVGAKKHQIDITDRQWEAIQAGAISNAKLEEILKNTDVDKLKRRALPKTKKGISAGKLATAKLRLDNGYSPSEVADSLGVSVSTLYRALGKEDQIGTT